MLHVATRTLTHTHVTVTSFFGDFNPGEVAETSPNQGSKHTRSLPSRLRQSELEPTLPESHASLALVRRMRTPSCVVHHFCFQPGTQGIEPGLSHYPFFHTVFPLSLRHKLFLCLLLLLLSPPSIPVCSHPMRACVPARRSVSCRCANVLLMRMNLTSTQATRKCKHDTLPHRGSNAMRRGQRSD